MPVGTAVGAVVAWLVERAGVEVSRSEYGPDVVACADRAARQFDVAGSHPRHGLLGGLQPEAFLDGRGNGRRRVSQPLLFGWISGQAQDGVDEQARGGVLPGTD